MTKSKAQLQARAAYYRGQQQAVTQVQQPTVTVTGMVQNPSVPWTEGLTLSQAIVAADYNGAADPRLIVLHRGVQSFNIQPRQLMRGDDVPLEIGDAIEIR